MDPRCRLQKGGLSRRMRAVVRGGDPGVSNRMSKLESRESGKIHLGQDSRRPENQK